VSAPTVSGEGSRGGLRGIHILEAPTFFLNRGPAWSKSGPVRVLWSSAKCRPTFPPTQTRCSRLLIAAPRHSSVSSNPRQPCLFSKLNRICNVPAFSTLRRLTPWRCTSLPLRAGRPTSNPSISSGRRAHSSKPASGLLPDRQTERQQHRPCSAADSANSNQIYLALRS